MATVEGREMVWHLMLPGRGPVERFCCGRGCSYPATALGKREPTERMYDRLDVRLQQIDCKARPGPVLYVRV